MFLVVAVRTAGSRGGEGDKHGQPQIASAKAAAHPTPSKTARYSSWTQMKPGNFRAGLGV
jgi:hypothetical protein